jgi:hypothetical protein
MRAYTVTRFGSCFPSITGVDDPSCTGEGEYLDSALVSGGEQESTWSPWSCLLREALYMPARSMEWQIIHAVCFDVCFLLSAPLYGQDAIPNMSTVFNLRRGLCDVPKYQEIKYMSVHPLWHRLLFPKCTLPPFRLPLRSDINARLVWLVDRTCAFLFHYLNKNNKQESWNTQSPLVSTAMELFNQRQQDQKPLEEITTDKQFQSSQLFTLPGYALT